MASKSNFQKIIQGNRPSRGLVWGALILSALFAFEIFNYSTTDFAMSDLLGDLRFLGIRWSTILALAFCGIDFAGIARLFTPEQGADEPTEVWYLFGAWLLAATMNAMLTWWGVTIAVLSHGSLGNAIVPRETLLKVVPIFVALIVLLIRVLIIGTFSVAGERLFSQDDNPIKRRKPARTTRRMPSTNYSRTTSTNSYRQKPVTRSATSSKSYRPVPKRNVRPEPTYHPVSMKPGSNREYNDPRN